MKRYRKEACILAPKRNLKSFINLQTPLRASLNYLMKRIALCA
jgi:hypothetical protein